ncbi:hypothetical protein [Asanoa siamensis]|uniref:Uncharacterized protein n=1 Tax=Asanoa siamensis TaxID=926357 RepID=A0ABQ4CM20_9ACTN|nr:hypothetical protein [Asanoa siamensis]GIF72327.1 hypothetical protein Asi02nite_18450 [Asanoa siamensis]
MSAKIESPATGGVPGLEVVANLCSAGGCPTIYRTADGDLLVQGYTTADNSGVELPAGEGLVRIPAALLAEAFHSL